MHAPPHVIAFEHQAILDVLRKSGVVFFEARCRLRFAFEDAARV